MNYNKISLQKKIKNDLQFKADFVPEINQKSYKSQTLLIGQIIKITKNNIYIDAGLKSTIKARKKDFIRTFFEIEKLINQRYSGHTYTSQDFLKNIKIGNKYKLIVYQIKSIDAGFFIDFEKTKEYTKTSLTFYELDYVKKQNQSLYGYVLNKVNGGFSVGINGLVAFIPNNKLQTKKQAINSKKYQKKKISYIDMSFEFKVININFERRNVILAKHDK